MKLFKKIISSIFLLTLTPIMAFAATPNLSGIDIFTPTAGDKSVGYLGQVFGTVGGVLHGTGGQLLGELFHVFNSGMVILASCILIYTVIMSVINTAQEGEFMGKKMSSVWVIFRAAMGIGILVPKYTGYSLVQVFVLWVAVQGVGLADKTWARAVDYLADEGGVVYVAPENAMKSSTGLAESFGTAQNVLFSAVCMDKLEDIAQKQYKENSKLIGAPAGAVPQYRAVWDSNNKKLLFGFKSGVASTQSICGSYSWAASPQGNLPQATFEQYKKSALEAMLVNITPIAKTVVDSSNQELTDNRKDILRQKVTKALMGATVDYENMVRPALQMAERTTGETWQKNLRKSKEEGWISVGSYYRDLADVNNKLSQAIKDYQPNGQAYSTNFKNDMEKTTLGGGAADAVIGTVGQMKGYAKLDVLAQSVKDTETNSKGQLSKEQQAELAILKAQANSSNAVTREAAIQQIHQMEDRIIKKDGSVPNVFDTAEVTTSAVMLGSFTVGTIAAATISPGVGIVLTGLMMGLTALYGTWMALMNSAGDPIAMVQSLGQGMVGIAVTLWIVGSVLLGVMTGLMSMGTSITGMGYGIQNGLKMFLPVVIGFIGVLFVNGMVLSAYVPLIPFLIFTFASIGWLISVLEAVVAGPLVAAAVTHPEGHDLLGKAEQAVMLLLGVFLRPVIMVIGFLAAVIICRVALRMVNAGFTHAIGGLTWGGANLFTLAAFMVIYTMIVISIINLVFNAGIVKLWETIWMWVGFHQPSSAVDQALQEVKGGAHAGAQSMSDAGGGLVKAGADHQAGKLDPNTTSGFGRTVSKDGQTETWSGPKKGSVVEKV